MADPDPHRGSARVLHELPSRVVGPTAAGVEDHAGAKPRSDRWSLLNNLAKNLGWLDDGLHRTLTTLFSYANADGIAWPSQRTLARNCGCHHGTISRRLARLAKMGFVRQVRRGHKSAGRAAVYQIAPPDQWPAAPEDASGQD